MNILVIGGNGFIGSNLVKALIKENHNVSVFDALTPDNQLQGVRYYTGDFVNIQDYKYIFNDIDIVYHLISTTTPNSKREQIVYDIESNLVSTIKLLNLCVDEGVKKIIFASSGGTVYGENSINLSEDNLCSPIGAYGINKFAIERYLETFKKYYGLDYTVLRISNPYGLSHKNKKQGLINVVLNNIKNGKPVEIWGDGSIERDYIFVDDVCAAFIKAIKYDDSEGDVFNICSSNSVCINDILKIINQVVKKDFEVTYTECRKIDIPTSKLNNSKAKRILNWEPKVELIDGIERLWIALNESK